MHVREASTGAFVLGKRPINSRRITGIAAALLLVCAAAQAQEPAARIEGLDGHPAREAVIDAIGEETAPATSRWRARERARTAADRAVRYLRSQGYYAAAADPRLDDDGRPLVRIRPGERFAFSAVSVALEASGPAPERSHAEPLFALEGRPVIAAEVLSALAETEARLRNHGYPQAELADRTITVDHLDQSAEAEIVFDAGPFIRLGAPQNAGGAADLRPRFVARLAPYEVGDPASVRVLEEYAERLQGLESVSLVDVRVSPDAEGEQRPVDVRLEPAPRHRIALGASYSTTEGPGATGEWARRNVFRGDETFTVAGQLASIESRLSAGIEIPHFRRYAQSLAFEADAARIRSDAFDQESAGVAASLNRRLSRTLTLSAGAEARFSRETDAAGVRSLVTGVLPVGLIYDDRNDVLDPSEGVYLSARAEPGVVFGDESARFVRTEGAARAYHRIAERVVLAGRVRAGALFGVSAVEAPADLRFFAGGGGSVRGFEFQALSPTAVEVRALSPDEDGETLFGGRSVFETSLEARWRRTDRLGFVAFVDAGAAGPDVAPDFGALRAAAGFGVRYYPGFGPLRLDLATPLDRRDGESPVQVYISIGQAF